MTDKKVNPRPYRRGVGLALFNREGLVFAARRIDTPEAWQMPQGGIDDGETAEGAALRELKEETGISQADIIAEHPQWLSYDLPETLSKNVWKGRYRGQTQKWFALRFTGEDSDINIHTIHPEFDDWRWLPLTALLDMIVPFKRDVYDSVIMEFLPLAERIKQASQL